MNWNNWIRQIHRWLAVAFTLAVIANMVVYAQGETPSPWLIYSPLFPLALLWFSGLLMFVRPYVAKWCGRGKEEKGV